jgi:PD-(D/E)XK nuclease superfamily protein
VCRSHRRNCPEVVRAGPGGAGERWSVSKQREPDLLLSVKWPGAKRFLLLDAKYRSSRESVLEAMGSAHVYRDSLRIGEQRAEGALLLIPAGGSVEWLEEPDFHRNHQVGVHVLAPGDDARMPDFVREFLIRWACI